MKEVTREGVPEAVMAFVESLKPKPVETGAKHYSFVIEIAYWSGRYEVSRRFCERDRSSIPAYFHPDNLVPTLRYIKGSSLE